MAEKITLGKQSCGGKTVGDVPFGIPVNIEITGTSLFEVLNGSMFL